MPLLAPPLSSGSPPQTPYPVGIKPPHPLPSPPLPPSLPPILPIFIPPSAVVSSPHQLCQAVGHVRTRGAKPGPSLHRCQHSSAQGVLGLRIPCSGMGVKLLLSLVQHLQHAAMKRFHPADVWLLSWFSQKPGWLSVGEKTRSRQIQWSLWGNQYHQ